jgi:hypothetical protein
MTDVQPEQEVQQPPPEDVTLRVAGLPYNEAFTTGDITITREGTAVSSADVDSILAEAQQAGMPLEVAE